MARSTPAIIAALITIMASGMPALAATPKPLATPSETDGAPPPPPHPSRRTPLDRSGALISAASDRDVPAQHQAVWPRPDLRSFDPTTARLVERRESADIYDLGGSKVAVLHSGQVNWNDAGTWKAIDSRLQSTVDGYKNISGPLNVRFPATTKSSDTLMSVGKDGWSVEFTMAGAVAGRPGTPLGSTIRYTEIQPNVDVEYQVGATEVKELVTVNAVPAGTGPLRFDFPMTTKGVTPRSEADGSIGFYDQPGTRVAIIPPGLAWDSSAPVAADAAATPVHVRLTGSPDAWVVQLEVSGEWAREAKRVMPLRIDPTFTAGDGNDGEDAYDSTACGACTYNNSAQFDGTSYVNRIGYSSPGVEHYTYLKFDLTPLVGKQNFVGELRYYTFSPGDGSFDVKKATEPWEDYWVSRDAAIDHVGGKTAISQANTERAVSVSEWIPEWVGGANYGMVLNTSGRNTLVTIGASEEKYNGTFRYPRLIVGYDDPPPVNLPPGASTPLSPANGATLYTARPWLQGGQAWDPEGAWVKYYFQVSTNPDPGLDPVATSPEIWPIGADPRPSWQIPANSLRDGGTYYWRVVTTDGTGGVTYSTVSSFRIDLRLGFQPASAFDNVGPVAVDLVTGNAVVTHAGPSFGTVGGDLALQFAYNAKAVEARQPLAANLPPGWTPAFVGATNLAYSHLVHEGNSIILVAPDGRTSKFVADTPSWVDGVPRGWIAPANDKAVVTQGADGAYIVAATDGRVYTFDTMGRLSGVKSAVDVPNRSSVTYSWVGSEMRITEPVSQRYVRLIHGPAGCPTAPAGYDTQPPGGMVCQAVYWDNTVSNLFYQSGRLARIEHRKASDSTPNANWAVTLFGYSQDPSDGLWRVSSIRDELASDAVHTGQRTDDDKIRTLIASSYGWVDSVTQPVAKASDDPLNRPGRTYGWFLNGNEGSTVVHVNGLTEPNGYARSVAYNYATKQITGDTDATAKTSTFTWDAGESLLSQIDPSGLKTTVRYDAVSKRPTDIYGPARQACFTGDLPSGTCTGAATVARQQAVYDERPAPTGGWYQGLTGAYWRNNSSTVGRIAGAPDVFDDLAGDATGALTIGTSGWPAEIGATDYFSARFTGHIDLPSTGDYTFHLDADDGVRLFIDDKLLIDRWVSGPAQTSSARLTWTAGRHRIRIDYYEHNLTAWLHLKWTKPGEAPTVQNVVPGTVLFPDFGLQTSTIDPDTKKTATEYHLPTRRPLATILDPNGANPARTTISYDDASESSGKDKYWRPRTRKLPGDATGTTFEYHTSDTAQNSCGISSGQLGHLKLTTGPGGVTKSNSLVDSRGRPAAESLFGSGQSSGSFACTTYDTRDRVDKFTDRDGNLVDNHYSVPGEIRTTFNDSAGTPRETDAEFDLLGRLKEYDDEHNTKTRITYDLPGRVWKEHRTVVGQPEVKVAEADYDAASRITKLRDYLSGASRQTTFTYDTAGRPDLTTRPNGVTTKSAYDTERGRLSSLAHKKSAADLSSWSYGRYASGRLQSEGSTGGTARPTRTFTYDSAARLSAVAEGGVTVRSYAFDINSNRCPVATPGGLCNTASTAYDANNRITKSAVASGYTYGDPNRPGLVTGITGTAGNPSVSLTYDSNDHVTKIDDGTTRVEETLAPSGRVLRRVIKNAAGTILEDITIGYNGPGDSPAYERSTTTSASVVAMTDDWTSGTWDTAKWTTDAYSGGAIDVTSTGEGRLTVTGDGDAKAFSIASARNSEVVLKYQFQDRSASSTFRVALRERGSSIQNGYRVEIPSDSGVVKLREHFDSGGGTTRDQFTYTTDTNPQYLRLRVDEGQIRAKLWPANQPEPQGETSWQLAYDDATPVTGSGVLQIHHNGNAGNPETPRYVTVDDVQLVTLGNTTSTKTYLNTDDGLLLSDVDGTGTWPLLNGHGDVIGTTNAAGIFTANPVVDEYGNGPVATSRLGWLGGYERFTTHPGSKLMRMGVRLYDPAIGRFLQPDPVLGGSLNEYDYGNADPCNQYDLYGRTAAFRIFKACLSGAVQGAVVTAITGPNIVTGIAAGCVTDAGAQAFGEFVNSDAGKAVKILKDVEDVVNVGTKILTKLF